MTTEEAKRAMNLAIGRLLRIMWTPQNVPGDHAAQYQDCRSVCLECAEVLGIDATDDRPNYARNYGNGAAGD